MSAIAQFPSESWVPWAASALSLVAAMVYLVILSPAVSANYKAPPAPVLAVAAAAYLVGAGRIPFADRRLLAVGALLNPLVMAAYVAAAIKGHAAVDRLSLTSKAAQAALEVLLLWLVLRPDGASGDLG